MLKVMLSNGLMGDTIRLVTTDVATKLSASVLTVAGRVCKGAIITIETASVRIAFGTTTPTQGASGVGHELYAGDSWELYGEDSMADFTYISSANGVPAVIQLTPLY